jgi:ABC-type antimicrobial peptide transport system permease subunit
MALGMACAILLLLWVKDEWSYDRHFKNRDQLFRVIERQFPTGGDVTMLAVTPSPLARTLKDEFPEIIRSSRYAPSPLTLKKGEEFVEETVASVDNDFLNMFVIEFIQGDMNSALLDPHNIILTMEMARKYFGSEDALGKSIESRGYSLKVTGIVKPLPHNSHFSFDFLVPIEWLKEFGAPLHEWWSRDKTYIELAKGTDSHIVEAKIRDVIKKHVQGSNSEILLQNVKSIHLYSSRKYTYDMDGHGDITYVRIMAIVALFILLIACINFMSLSTAQSARRVREIGVRKVAGAGRRKIIVQFLGESLLIVFVAHVIAMILVELMLPAFNRFTGKELDINYSSAGLYSGLIGMILFCGFLAGSYPALYLSSLRPLESMKGIISHNRSSIKFRKILVVFQFSLSVILVICTLIIGKQLNYLQNKNLGFNRDNIGYFMFPTRPGEPILQTLKKELAKGPDIESVTIARPNPFNNEGTESGFSWEGKLPGEDVLFHTIGSDEEYATTFQLEMKEGRFFSSGFTTDATAVVINETAAKVIGFKHPVGETITTPQGSKLTIIGVVKDFHFQSLHYKIEPLLMQLGDDNNFIVKMKPEHVLSTVDFITKTFATFNPPLPLDFHFLDDDYDKLYKAESRISKIFGFFTFLTIIIACLGLIGLSSFMAERRTKEIGIRKVNGARSFEIFILLSKEYVILVMIAFLIATTPAWYAIHKWLQNFAFRIQIDWWVFALAGIIMLLLTILTVGFQSWKAAERNPVDALRFE